MNRRAILDRLREEMARARRERTSLGVGMVDIDRFKRVNDTHGDAAGDRVLCEVAVRARTAVRRYDAFGRCGGEEFLAIVPDSPYPEILKVLERVRLAARADPLEIDEGLVPVTVSIGGAVASWSGGGSGGDPAEGLAEGDVDGLIRRADDALYRAKEEGRDRVVMADVPR